MAEREDEQARSHPRNEVRDFEAGGDVSEDSHSAFAHDGGGHVHHNDERLGGRGRNSGRDESGFLDDLEHDRAHPKQDAGPGEVRGLEPPDKDDVGA